METMDVTDWIVLTTRLPAWKPQNGDRYFALRQARNERGA